MEIQSVNHFLRLLRSDGLESEKLNENFNLEEGKVFLMYETLKDEPERFILKETECSDVFFVSRDNERYNLRVGATVAETRLYCRGKDREFIPEKIKYNH